MQLQFRGPLAPLFWAAIDAISIMWPDRKRLSQPARDLTTLSSDNCATGSERLAMVVAEIQQMKVCGWMRFEKFNRDDGWVNVGNMNQQIDIRMYNSIYIYYST